VAVSAGQGDGHRGLAHAAHPLDGLGQHSTPSARERRPQLLEQGITAEEDHGQRRYPVAPHLGGPHQVGAGGVAYHVEQGFGHPGGRCAIEIVDGVQGLGAVRELSAVVQADRRRPGPLAADLVDRHHHLFVRVGGRLGVPRH